MYIGCSFENFKSKYLENHSLLGIMINTKVAQLQEGNITTFIFFYVSNAFKVL